MKLFGHDITIEYVDDLGMFGQALMDRGLIRISNNISESQKESTLLHEVIELVNRHLGLELSEAQIRGVEVGLFEWLSQKGEQDE